MEIVTKYQTKNMAYQTATPIAPVGIILHSTGANNPNLRRYVDYPERLGVNQFGNHFNRGNADQIAHYYIGLEKDGKVIAVQTLPLDIACWGCGGGNKGSANYNPHAHIQIEICEDQTADQTYYTACFKGAAELCADLCREYGWSSEAVISHKEAAEQGLASAHEDPEHWLSKNGHSMTRFRTLVKKRMNGKTPTTMYRVHAGSFKQRGGAEAMSRKLEEAGFETWIEEVTL